MRIHPSVQGGLLVLGTPLQMVLGTMQTRGRVSMVARSIRVRKAVMKRYE